MDFLTETNRVIKRPWMYKESGQLLIFFSLCYFFRATKTVQNNLFTTGHSNLTFFIQVRECQYTNLTDTKRYFFYVRPLFWIRVLLLGISDCNTPVFRADGQSEMRLKRYSNIVYTATDVRNNQRNNGNACTSCSRILKQQSARNRRHAANRGRAKISFCKFRMSCMCHRRSHKSGH